MLGVVFFCSMQGVRFILTPCYMDVLDMSLLLYILIDGASEVDRIAEC